MTTVTESAHAKINLTLEVLGKRANGFHNLVTVIATVGLCDTLTFAGADELRLLDDGGIPAEDNLVLRAAHELQRHAGVQDGAHISLDKKVPEAAGLGGGSADAAATLRGLNRLWRLEMTLPELAVVGAAIGSDVPFLVYEGAALVQGRGEEVVPIPRPPIDRVLILSPEIRVADKTRTLFSRMKPSFYTRGTLSHKLAARIRAGHDAPAEFFFNAFEPLAPEVFSGWREYRDALAALGAREITLSGAGPSMFAVPPTRELATAWLLLLTRTRGWTAFLTEPFMPASESARC